MKASALSGRYSAGHTRGRICYLGYWTSRYGSSSRWSRADEAGFAQGLGIPVISSARADQIGDSISTPTHSTTKPSQRLTRCVDDSLLASRFGWVAERKAAFLNCPPASGQSRNDQFCPHSIVLMDVGFGMGTRQ